MMNGAQFNPEPRLGCDRDGSELSGLSAEKYTEMKTNGAKTSPVLTSVKRGF